MALIICRYTSFISIIGCLNLIVYETATLFRYSAYLTNRSLNVFSNGSFRQISIQPPDIFFFIFQFLKDHQYVFESS